MTSAPPIDETIATWNQQPLRLLGGRCEDCGTHTFPRLDGCPRCGADDIEAAALSPRGTLWTWTTQDFPVKRPYVGRGQGEDFEPFLLGYVELPEGVKVESRLVDCTRNELEIGMTMELTPVHFETNDERGAVTAFGFRPANGQEVAA